MRLNDPTLFRTLRPLMKSMLQSPDLFDWTVQGFGMLRCYPGTGESKKIRLNIWDPRVAVPHVSVIHDHPWHLSSIVISGELTNIRYIEDPNGAYYSYMTIKTGEGGGPSGRSEVMRLSPLPSEIYGPGEVYFQTATEIHESRPMPGCVSLNDRERVGDGEHARVFWPHGQAWVDAEPRPATPDEIRDASRLALLYWKD